MTTIRDVRYRWVNGVDASDAEWDKIESILAARGWASLNRPTSRVLIAEAEGELVGLHVFQLFPHPEPQWVRPSYRGTDVSATLADKMMEFLTDIKVRGFMVVAESQFAIELCESRGMMRVESPVYIAK